MASIHNEIRNRTDVLRAFERFFRLEHGAGIERIGETLTPILDMWSRPEQAALLGEQLWWANFSFGAVALQSSWLAIYSAAASKRLITILGWATDIANPLTGSLPQATVVAGDTGAADARDRRFGSSSSVTGVRKAAGSEVPTTITTSWARSPANTIIPIPVVISPGNNWAVENPTVNQAFAVSIFGYVRLATDDELKLSATA